MTMSSAGSQESPPGLRMGAAAPWALTPRGQRGRSAHPPPRPTEWTLLSAVPEQIPLPTTSL